MKWLIPPFTIILVSVLISCKQSSTANAQFAQRDTSVTPQNSYSELFFDSTAMEKFIKTERLHDSMASRMKSFYNGRNYQYAWFFKEGIADYAQAFINVVDDYIGYSGDSALYDASLHQLVDSISEEESFNVNDSNVLKTELMLTRKFFQCAHRALQGRNQLNAEELEWFIPRKKIDLVALLDSVVENKGKNVSVPVNRQYGLLKSFLLKYYTIEKNGGWASINADKKFYRPGDSSKTISEIKKRLVLTEDLSGADTSAVYSLALAGAVKSFQRRYGFKQDGIVNSQLIKEMNRPVSERIRQMLINMERIRWVPAQPTTDYILVNIPEFRLHVYEKGNYQWSMNIVVGSTAHNTVIFAGTLKYIVFSPYWNVPPSILKKEILPAIRRNKNYLATHNMEWYENGVRQKPGPNNSLGLVKFLFPNAYNIYLHDTPAKSLFGEDRRAFSHGCIRLSEPARLARFLLRNYSNWDSLKIIKAMNARKEQFVTVKETVPVYIGYFTAWVDREGKLNFRNDIYGHDQKMAARMFSERHD
jgi:murein L,D-transpeptidase YcbB/YkuD